VHAACTNVCTTRVYSWVALWHQMTVAVIWTIMAYTPKVSTRSFNVFVVNCHNLNLDMESMLWFCCLFDGKSTTAYSLTYSKTLYRSAIFFRGVPLMGCCHVDDTSSEHADVGLAPGWVDADVSQLYTSIGPPQVCRCQQGLLQSFGCLRSDCTIHT